MRRLMTVVTVGVLAVGGCAGTDRSTGDRRNAAPGSEASVGPAVPDPAGGLVRLRVFADESLRETLTRVEATFEMQNPNIEVVTAYGEGGEMARRIADGEKADLLIAGEPSEARAGSGQPERIGRLSVLDLDGAGGPADSFATFLREGEGKRILIDSGLLRP